MSCVKRFLRLMHIILSLMWCSFLSAPLLWGSSSIFLRSVVFRMICQSSNQLVSIIAICSELDINHLELWIITFFETIALSLCLIFLVQQGFISSFFFCTIVRWSLYLWRLLLLIEKNIKNTKFSVLSISKSCITHLQSRALRSHTSLSK